MSEKNVPLFSNKFVKCYSDYFVISLYYFPFGSKKIRYDRIRSCELRRMADGDMFDYKLWGMALSPIWWHCDFSRLSREYFVLIDANQWPMIGITMDDQDIIHFCNFVTEKIFSSQSKEKPYSSEKEKESTNE